MLRFNRAFHQSDVATFKHCPRMFYYRNVLELEPERLSETALAGSALHAALAQAHTDQVWDPDALFAFWQEDLAHRVEETISRGTDIRHGTIEHEHYRHMLAGYVAKPWNRQAEIVLLEHAFCFAITPSTTEYLFAGRLDQVIRVPTQLLIEDFPVFGDFPHPTVLLHRDLKTGRRKGTGSFELLLNDQLSIYAYALQYGTFDLDGDGICEAHLNLTPDFHALYFLQDHIPYKRPPKGKPAHCRGPGMYFTERPLARLERIPTELMPVCASVRRGDFARAGMTSGLCENYCSVRQYCEAELLQEIH